MSEILPRIKPADRYIEPFCGAASVGIAVMQKGLAKSHWWNDLDFGIYSLWLEVKNAREELKEDIRNFTPSIKSFDEFRSNLLERTSANQGFKKLALHQMSYSGLGLKSGGPLGGRSEGNVAGGSSSVAYPIDCRWSPKHLTLKIDKLAELISNNSLFLSCLAFPEVLWEAKSNDFVYLDPPYFVKGKDLYWQSMTENAHKDLSNILRNANFPWLLSYDDCAEVREMYSGWANIHSVKTNYSIKSSRTASELLIYGNN